MISSHSSKVTSLCAIWKSHLEKKPQKSKTVCVGIQHFSVVLMYCHAIICEVLRGLSKYDLHAGQKENSVTL